MTKKTIKERFKQLEQDALSEVDINVNDTVYEISRSTRTGGYTLLTLVVTNKFLATASQKVCVAFSNGYSRYVEDVFLDKEEAQEELNSKQMNHCLEVIRSSTVAIKEHELKIAKAEQSLTAV